MAQVGTVPQPIEAIIEAKVAARFAELEIKRRSSSIILGTNTGHTLVVGVCPLTSCTGQTTFAEYYEWVIKDLGPDASGQTTFWINLQTPERGVKSTLELHLHQTPMKLSTKPSSSRK